MYIGPTVSQLVVC